MRKVEVQYLPVPGEEKVAERLRNGEDDAVCELRKKRHSMGKKTEPFVPSARDDLRSSKRDKRITPWS